METNKLVPIIIPSYEPDDRLISLLLKLDELNMGPVILVNDGSGKQYDEIFFEAENIIKRQAGVCLIHEVNRGKGRALKTAFKYVLDNFGSLCGVVTADSDGQHTPECIQKVKEKLLKNPNNLVLGVRNFSGEDIPWKSRFGNTLTEKVFAYVAGAHVSDTQTGLRGIPKQFM